MKSWRIFSWRDVEFRLNPAVILFLVYAAITRHLLYALLTLLSILLHECAHALMALLLGQRSIMIELTPMGAVMRLREADNLPRFRQALMIIAGPALTFVLCCLSIHLVQAGIIAFEFSRVLFASNLSLLMINLIPAYPLDGGRLLALFMGTLLPQRAVQRVMRYVGIAVGMLLIGLNLYCCWKIAGWNLSLAMAGCCLIYSAHAETTTWALAELLGVVDRKVRLEKCSKLPGSLCVVMDTTRLDKLVRALPERTMQVFLCLEAGTLKTIGWLTESEAIQAYLQTPDATIGTALKMSQNRARTSKYDTN